MNYHALVKQERTMAHLRRLRPEFGHLKLEEVTVFRARCMCPLYENRPHYQAIARGETICPRVLYGHIFRLCLRNGTTLNFTFDEIMEKCKC